MANKASPRRKPSKSPTRASLGELPKTPSGIRGLDEITGGGLPRGRPTLIAGGPGCGKTLFGVEFLVRGAIDYGEPGVLMSFEETREELAANVASLGFDLRVLEAQGKLAIDHVHVEKGEIEETGEYDLEGLFVRLQYAIDGVGAKRVVLDTLEALFSGLPNPAILRSELRRLFRWLKERGQTVVLTGEKGEGTLTRQGLEEYVSDCVIFLDHRVIEQTSTRRLRVVKYRGSSHGTNEYPFLIDESGISVLPVTSLSLDHQVSSQRISTGVPRLDAMLGGKGYYRGSTILISGTAGAGKTTVAATLAHATAQRGERCLYFSYEESADQVIRNMRSVGVDLESHVAQGKVRFIATRPTLHGLEMHLASTHRMVTRFEPHVVIVDPITNLTTVGSVAETQSMMIRLIDFLKSRGTTCFFTSLTAAGEALEQSIGISSLVDTWLLLSVVRSDGERNRTLSIIKSRGMGHSNQASEFRLTEHGIELLDPYLGPEGFLMGSARLAKEAEEEAAKVAHAEELARMQARHERRRRSVQRRISELQEQLAVQDAELERVRQEEARRNVRVVAQRTAMARSRQAFWAANGEATRTKGKGRR